MFTRILLVLSALAVLAFAGAGSASADPTCSGTLGIDVHGQHIVGDYVTGIGHSSLDWPPSGGVVGDAVRANGGVAVAGGPGPGFHFPNGFSPGASFCLDQSQAPGTHLGP
ncbi:MAG TPA: hypothetical protein VNI55_08370 [Gaiellaceae bacterium]|nr:hypothetical protein [Gaiellaceae bacterium]